MREILFRGKRTDMFICIKLHTAMQDLTTATTIYTELCLSV